MKKILLSLLAVLSALGPVPVCSAQEETPSKVKLYGFIRNYMVFDTHEVSAGTQDLYFYMPKDRKMVDGVDENANPSFRMLALTTRLGLNVGGYRVGDLQVNGTVEADFYCMSGSMAALRLRHAYVGLLWDNLELGDLQVNVGQTWHPMAADLPHITNLETGAPFNPFNRSPQVMFHWTVGKFTWTGGILYPMQFLPVGPTLSTGPAWNSFTEQYEPTTTYGTTTALTLSVPMSLCRNASNNLTVQAGISYGIYPGAAVPTFQSTGALTSTYINFRAPSWSVRTNSSYMASTAWQSVSAANTTIRNRQRLYRVRKQDLVELAYLRMEAMIANGEFPTEVI